MHDLEQLITEWRKSAATDFNAGTLDELETHLRETTEQLVRSGMNLSEAFTRGVAELGTLPKISLEFKKLDEPLWFPIKLAVGALGVTVLVALVLAILVIARRGSGPSNLLLAIHVLAVTLGYTLTLLIGSLGICFVSQRCLEDFSTSRLRSIARVSLVLATIASFFTALGVLLGAVWAKVEWGRYWGWDSKEIGGLSVVVWLTFYVIAHRFLRHSARGILAISTLGNVVASLAWFGPQLNGLHQYGTFSQSMLLAVVVANLIFFAIGYCPAGWLRAKRA